MTLLWLANGLLMLSMLSGAYWLLALLYTATFWRPRYDVAPGLISAIGTVAAGSFMGAIPCMIGTAIHAI